MYIIIYKITYDPNDSNKNQKSLLKLIIIVIICELYRFLSCLLRISFIL